MRYTVSRKTKLGMTIIAQTLYLEDAQCVLANWHSGAITRDGEIVFEKKGS